MADLGTIGFIEPGGFRLPGTDNWTTYPGAKSDIAGLNEPTGRITGIAQVAGVAAPGHAVHLIERSTRRIVRTTYAGTAGAFQFDALELTTENYMVMIMDESDTGSYNSKTADRVTAVSV